jgi:hypothetical protein
VPLLAKLGHMLPDIRVEQRLTGFLAPVGQQSAFDRVAVSIPPLARKTIRLGPYPIDRPDHSRLPTIVGR